MQTIHSSIPADSAESLRILILQHKADDQVRPAHLQLLRGARPLRRLGKAYALRVEAWQLNELRSDDALTVYPDPVLMPAGSVESAVGLPEVLHRIGAPLAWSRSRGEGAYVAVIDSGINGRMAEFPDWKKFDGWAADKSDPWADAKGHGTMCAVIAAGTTRSGKNEHFSPKLDGVAPDARLLSCKLNEHSSSEVIDAFDWLLDQVVAGIAPIVANCSLAFETGDEPQELGEVIKPDHLLAVKIRQAVEAGITVVWAAGNCHDKVPARHRGPCDPSTIWAWNSMEEVLTVGTVDQDDRLWDYSSRGPGAVKWTARPKPDCVAPTYGRILYGEKYGDSETGWGTSGAAPQAAGLAALLASQRKSDAPSMHLDRIRSTCEILKESCVNGVGRGLIRCDRAVY